MCHVVLYYFLKILVQISFGNNIIKFIFFSFKRLA